MTNKEINFMRSNNRLKLTAPSVHACCYSAGVDDLGPQVNKRAPRPAA